MNKLIKKSLMIVLTSAVITLGVSGCSDDKAPAPASAKTSVAQPEAIPEAKKEYETFDVKPDTVVTEVERLKFEHDFTAQCVERETKNSVNKEEDEVRATKDCECITKEVSKTLTDEEAEKFVGEHEDPQSLAIKFKSAAYKCLEGKAKPAEPSFTYKGQGGLKE
ncbi:hypothetical protein [Crenothrix polyspora]|uniref:Lipoprotein n=1 Tax=Crenothrix polyspora TaxID=360316 RepID=A0A1R4HBK6_9GAMM|nr:hypothetical protein [Crenothrix polyspora]SJM93421.1 conserved exported hypothetical protein [Crenothrix polyspora]